MLLIIRTVNSFNQKLMGLVGRNPKKTKTELNTTTNQGNLIEFYKLLYLTVKQYTVYPRLCKLFTMVVTFRLPTLII